MVDFDDAPAEFDEPVAEHIVEEAAEDVAPASVVTEVVEVVSITDPAVAGTDQPADGEPAASVVGAVSMQDDAGNIATVRLETMHLLVLPRCWLRKAATSVCQSQVQGLAECKGHFASGLFLAAGDQRDAS